MFQKLLLKGNTAVATRENLIKREHESRINNCFVETKPQTEVSKGLD